MTREEAKKLPLGLYRIYWKQGGYSLAAIGQLDDGNRWMAPINWTNKSEKNICTSTHWKYVKSVKRFNRE